MHSKTCKFILNINLFCQFLFFFHGIMKERIIAHLDMDAFFASVEQHDNPEYTGKPVIIGADPKNGKGRGVVSTASYEARKFGVHSAMPISKAYQLCPQGIFVYPRMRRYSEVSNKIMEILSEFTPLVEQLSIDEAFMDLTGTTGLWGLPEEAAKKIKNKIFMETGLSCSIGIASNKSIAKIASDLEKPDGLTICKAGNEKNFLEHLSLKHLWGVGPKSLLRLNELGFTKIGDIARLNPEFMINEFGVSGYKLWELANGIDDREIESDDSIKSISEENTFEVDTTNKDQIVDVFTRQVSEVSRRLRLGKLKCKTVYIKIRLEDFTTYTRQYSLPEAVDDFRTLQKFGMELLNKNYRFDIPLRLIGMGVCNFPEENPDRQLDLFTETTDKKQNEADHLLDQLQAIYGKKVDRATFLKK